VATPTQIRRRGRLSFIVGAILATAALAAVAFAGDGVTADGDAVDATQSNPVSVTLAANASVTKSVSFILTCRTQQHVDSGDVVPLTFSAAGSTKPTGGNLTGTNGAVGPRSAGWPNDGSPCADPPPTVSSTAPQLAQVTISAPGAPGTYTYVASWTIGSTGESNDISGSSVTATYNVTVTNPDADGDGVADASDNCPTVANPSQTNNDGDAQGDACDPDDDNDTVADNADNCQFTANTDQANNDGDAQGDACDADDDNDTVADNADNCQFTANTDQANNDGDAQGDACDADDDNDTIADGSDNCQFTANTDQADTDGDGLGNACDADNDNDTVPDATDNCPSVANSDQANNDGDSQGDACDADDDNDTVLDAADNCQFTANSDQANNDGDSQGDACDADDDNDTVLDAADNCQFTANSDQANNDGDSQGDACDADDDNDTVLDAADNCQFTANSDQANNDGDSQGDVCDADDDNDGVADATDNCQFVSNDDQADADTDGLGNVCDPNAFAPVVETAAGDASGNEGSTLETSGSFSDADTDPHLTVTKLSGAGTVTDLGGGSWKWSHQPDDNYSDQEVVVQVSDDGAEHTATDSFKWSSANVAPTAAINDAPASSPEGTAISLTSAVTDPGTADTHTYVWSVKKDGVTYGSGGTSANFSFTPDDNGSYEVKLTVTDDDGGTGTDTESITVTNVDPTATINGAPASSSPEGTAISLTSAVTDPGTADTHTYVWSVKKDGVTYGSGGTSANFSFTPDDNGAYEVRLTVTDDDGGSGSDSETITVTNVAPSFVATYPKFAASAVACPSAGTTNATLSFNFTDPGTADTWTVYIDWDNDGTFEFSRSASKVDSEGHTYSTNGSHTAAVKVVDDDSGMTGVQTASVNVLYNTSGILQPINTTGTRSAFKLGSTIPVKVKITDCSGNPVSTLSPQISLVKLDGSPDGTAVEDFYSTVPDQGSTMRFTGSPDNQYIYNLGTKNLTQGDYKITITDPTIAAVSATFSLRK
jgi:hypothetical protein